MEDADVIDDRFWAIAQEIGPLRAAPAEHPRHRISAAEAVFFLVTGPVFTVVLAWSIAAVALAH